MTDQNTFMELLRDVGEIMRTSEQPMSEQEILTYFEDMELSDEHKRLIMDYLKSGDRNSESENVEGDSTGAIGNREGAAPVYHNGDYDDDISTQSGRNDFFEMEAASGQTGIDAASENSKVLQAYMEDLSLLETYSEEEIMGLYRQLFSGQDEVIETLSTIWLKKVLEIAKEYIDLHTRLEDLIQEGNMALLMRLNELCGTPDCSDAEMEFSQIEERLKKSVERGITDYISEWNSAKEQESTLIGKLSLVHEASCYLTEENGEQPTLKELSEYTKMSVEELTDLKEFMKK